MLSGIKKNLFILINGIQKSFKKMILYRIDIEDFSQFHKFLKKLKRKIILKQKLEKYS